MPKNARRSVGANSLKSSREEEREASVCSPGSSSLATVLLMGKGPPEGNQSSSGPGQILIRPLTDGRRCALARSRRSLHVRAACGPRPAHPAPRAPGPAVQPLLCIYSQIPNRFSGQDEGGKPGDSGLESLAKEGRGLSLSGQPLSLTRCTHTHPHTHTHTGG